MSGTDGPGKSGEKVNLTATMKAVTDDQNKEH